MIASAQKQFSRIAFAFVNEHFISALRTTITIVIPVIICYSLGYQGAAIDIGLGTLLVGLSDVPGNLSEKLNSLLIGSVALSLVSLSTLLVSSSSLLLGVVLTLFCFSFSMLTFYGGSVSAIGSISLIMMVFSMGLKPVNDVYFSLFILAGGFWYTLSAVLYLSVFPYRPVRQALSECIAEVAEFLRSKACFYQTNIPLNDCYHKVISGHIKVSEKQDAVRLILLDERLLAYHENIRVKQLIRLAAEVIDLYEQILAVHYDYAYIRQTLDDLSALRPVNQLIEYMADELYETSIFVGRGIHRKVQPTGQMRLLTRQLKDAAARAPGLKARLIGRIVMNFEAIHAKIELIGASLSKLPEGNHTISDKDAIRFANNQSLDWKQMRHHFTIQAPIFRFALRVTFTCLIAYLLMLFMLPGKYNYWLLLTIIIVVRPGFSTTRKRNIQRITGTLTGMVAAFIVLHMVQQNSLQIMLVILCLLGYLSFLYINYMVSVMFITLVAIVGLHLLGGNNDDLMLQRGYETLLGGAAALTAAFLFPFWESRKLKDLVNQVVTADIAYLEHLRDLVLQRPFAFINYKLARKQVFVSSANLSRAYQHMLVEPRGAVIDSDMLYQFQIFNHELYASVASLLLDQVSNSRTPGEVDHLEIVDRSIAYLNDASKAINGIASLSVNVSQYDREIKPVEGTLHREIMRDQLQLICDLSRNIYLQLNKMALSKRI